MADRSTIPANESSRGISALLAELAEPDAALGTGWEEWLRPGAVVGRFELVREIGRGGFGVVWEARDRELGRAVAFKAVRAGDRAAFREERLLREAEAAARLSHPNIVTLYDLGRSERGPYLVLELLRGQPLSGRSLPLPAGEALRVATEIARALAHAHAHGVVHRDLKPANVVLCDDGRVKVLDFGLAHAFGLKAVRGGTPPYMAPEQWRGAPEDERTDVFALGAVLYEMLSGAPPFPGRDAPGAPPALELPGSPELPALVARMLATDPVERPRDGAEVLAALERISVPPHAAPVRVKKRWPMLTELRRRRVFRALVGYGIAAFAVLQIIEPVMHGLHWPEGVLSVVVVALASGFPLVVTLAWVFDRTERRVEPGSAGWRAAVLIGIGALAAAPGLAWYLFLRQAPASAAGSSAAPSIAVLPFVDMSPGKDQEYFSDGIAEEILNDLAHVEGLHVAGRTSSFSFKGKSEDLRTIAVRLNVGTVLEGSVRREGNRLRVTAQLVDASNGYDLWSETYEREMTGVFAIEDEIARAVVGALKPRLLPGARGWSGKHRTTDVEAYREYLLGRHFYSLHSEEGFKRAVEAEEKAVALDPQYAPAWATLAVVTFALGDAFADSASVYEATLRRAREAADRAVLLDPGSAAACIARGLIRQNAWDWSGALEDLQQPQAQETADGQRMYADVLASQGRLTEALQALQKAAEMDPLAPTIWNSFGKLYNATGQLDLARRALDRALELAPDSFSTRYHLASSWLIAGDPARAREVLQSYSASGNRLIATAMVEHDLGHAKESRAALDAAIVRYGHNYGFQIAEAYAWMGDRDSAFAWLDRAYAQHDGGFFMLKWSALLRSLRADPRYFALLRRLKLPED